MKVNKVVKGHKTGGLMNKNKIRKVTVILEDDRQYLSGSLMQQVENDRRSDSLVYRAHRNVSARLHQTSKIKDHRVGQALRILILFMVMAFTFSQTGPFFAGQSDVSAQTAINRWGTVTGNGVNLRSGPNTTSSIVDTIAKNSRVNVVSQVKGEATSSYGDQWYQLKYVRADGKAIEGYMVAGLVKLDEVIPATDEYAKKYQASGFPASYWPALRELNIKYPNWIFTPMFIDSKYDWETIIKGQSAVGRSLIPNSWSNALKSYSEAAFNYRNDQWIAHDSSSWVMANNATIGYYLDPRNWLYEDTVFMFENLKYNSGLHTRAGVASILSGTFMDGRDIYQYQEYDAANKAVGAPKTGTQIDHFMEAAVRSGVSPYHLAARARLEVVVSGGGKSGSVTGTYEDPLKILNLKGLYNYYNVGATQGTNPIRNGLEYALYGPGRKPEQTETDNKYLIPWNSPWRAIVGGAMFIGNSYISRNQHTLYLQKFDLDDAYDQVFWHQYMGNLHAPAHEGRTTYSAYKAMNQLNNSFEFVVPVIAGMPDQPSPLPTDARSRNSWLKTLDVSGLTLNQKFDSAKTEYSVTLNYDFTAVTITGSTVNAKGKIEGTGTYSILPGTNIISVMGIAEAGQKREYIVSVIRKAEDGTVPPDIHRPQNPIPSLSFSQKQIKVQDNTMTGLDPAQNLNAVEQFVSSLGIPAGYQVQVLKSDGKPQTDLIGTGNIVRISFENLMSQDYRIVIYGDTNGDGRITSSDLNQIFNHVLQKSELKDVYAKAADVDKNDRVTSADLNQVFNHVLQKSAIIQ